MSMTSITYQAQPVGYTTGQNFGCGDSYTGLSVIVFSGPGDARIAAFCANPNIDVDGDPQAYGRHDNPRKIPTDSLQDAGWLDTTQNAQAKRDLADLPAKLAQQRDELAALAENATQARKALSAKIAKGEQRLARLTALTQPHTHDSSLPGFPRLSAKYLGEKFWDWYGVVALTPEEARTQLRTLDGETDARGPRLAKEYADGAQFEDLFGRYPVIQSAFEPGSGFFVSALPRPINPAFPVWDQRSTLQPDARSVEPYMALSNYLQAAPASLSLGHCVFGYRLKDGTGTAVTMKYLDSAAWNAKVGEISLPAFSALGGTVPDVIFAANKVRNNFLVLYIAVPVTNPMDVYPTFARLFLAPNRDELPVMLAFVAEATVKATGSTVPGSTTINVPDNPMAAFERWRRLPPNQQFLPSTFDDVLDFLKTMGYVPSADAAFAH